jgi:hypothetical protein
MPELPTDRLVRLWEQGVRLSPLARTLLLTRAASPDLDAESVRALGLGARDRLLLELREQLFGSALPLYTICSTCRTELELHLQVADVRAPAAPAGAIYTLEHAGIEVGFRVPCSADLLALRVPDSGGGRDSEVETALVLRCIVYAKSAETAVEPRALPAEVMDAVAQDIAKRDPQADLFFEIRCPECQRDTQAVLDIGSYLWTELDVAIRRLLLDVHTLARAYGWSESEILKMSSVRRQFYLDALEAEL